MKTSDSSEWEDGETFHLACVQSQVAYVSSEMHLGIFIHASGLYKEVKDKVHTPTNMTWKHFL